MVKKTKKTSQRGKAKTTLAKKAKNPTAKVTAKRSTGFKRVGKTTRKATRYTRNPDTSALKQGVEIGLASAVVEFAQLTFVPKIGGPGLYADAARTLATGYLLGKAASLFSITRRYQSTLTVGGAAVAAAKIARAVVLPMVSRYLAPAAVANGNGAGMNGLYVLPGNGQQALPAAPQSAGNKPVKQLGMNGAMVVRRA